MPKHHLIVICMTHDIPPISSIYLTNVENIPLSLCRISGTTIVINFVQCDLDCMFCPWDVNASIHSSRIINVHTETILNAVEKYKPDIIFFNGGNPWRYAISKMILSTLPRSSTLIGVKVISYLSNEQDYNLMLGFVELCDIILVEINRYTNVNLFLNIVEKYIKDKHIETVIIGDINNVSNNIDVIINNLISRRILIPINLVLDPSQDRIISYRFVYMAKKKYPIIYVTSSPSTEFSSILCPNCNRPIVVRSHREVIKLSLDNYCRCIYCYHKVISTEKNICITKRPVKIPIKIPIA